MAGAGTGAVAWVAETSSRNEVVDSAGFVPKLISHVRDRLGAPALPVVPAQSQARTGPGVFSRLSSSSATMSSVARSWLFTNRAAITTPRPRQSAADCGFYFRTRSLDSFYAIDATTVSGQRGGGLLGHSGLGAVGEARANAATDHLLQQFRVTLALRVQSKHVLPGVALSMVG